MAQARIVITGPNGWIGRAFLAALARRGQGWEQNVRLFGSSARTVAAPDGTLLAMRPLEGLSADDTRGAHVIHLAYLTKEKVDSLGERAFFDTNAAIDEALARAVADGAPAGLFVASSGAAKQAADGRDRHLYGICKILQEDRFLAIGAKSGFPVTAGRVWNIAGPFINKLTSYAVSNFIVQARQEGSIRIDAHIPVYRAYLHVSDLVSLVLAGLEAGTGFDHAVDLTGAHVVEMDDVARAVGRATGLDEDRIERGPIDYGKSSLYLGDPTPARTLALRFGIQLKDFARQVADTVAYIDADAR